MDRPNTQNSSIFGGGGGRPRRYHNFFFFLLSESIIVVVCLYIDSSSSFGFFPSFSLIFPPSPRPLLSFLAYTRLHNNNNNFQHLSIRATKTTRVFAATLCFRAGKKIFGISCMLFLGSDQRIVSKALEWKMGDVLFKRVFSVCGE